MTLDTRDRQILHHLQENFPIVSQPFDAVATALGLSESEVLDCVRRLTAEKRIRAVGPVYDLQRLGYVSTLCAAQVDPARLEAVAERAGSFVEVTHNYEREHRYNLWFTVIASTPARLEEVLAAVRAEPGVGEAVAFPAEKTYKNRVRFDLTGERP